jgi:TonB family protein
MGYQALLFCPDDKLARVVSQVFTELDFAVELAHEPFGAVKKLMTQRFDAVVVDCENEQNASLLFKSARNSSSNQSSLAIAVVEGQAGVAKAYRIGANLVLTKPINVEQAKGTLRVARGLLRKNSEGANASFASAPSASQPAKIAPPVSGPTFQSAGKGTGATAATSQPELPEFESPDLAPVPSAMPAAAASVTAEDNPPSVPAPATQDTVVKTVDHAFAEPQPASADAVTTTAVTTTAPLVQSSTSAHASTPGSAAAPAPAKTPAAPSAEATAPAKPSYDATPSFGTTYGTTYGTTLGASDAPSLGAVGEDSGGSGAGKKILIAAAVILVLTAIGYLGFEKFGKSGATPSPQPASVQQSSAQPSAPSPAPVAPPETTATAKTPDRASSTSPILAVIAAAAAPSDKSAGKSPVTRIDLAPEQAPKKLDVTPLKVKSTTVKGKAHAQGDESAAPPPDTLAAAPDDSNISALMSSASSAPKPSLATLKVSQGVSQGLLIKRVPPRYPPAALAVHTQGEVQIEATINTEGNVVNPKVLSGDRVLAKAALDAVRQWRYKPYYLDGAPVEIQTQITIRFKAE